MSAEQPDPTPARPCSRCQAEPAEPGQRWGRSCRNAHKRTQRKINPMTDEERKRANCRSATRVYVRRGVLVKRPCEVCGDEKSQAHHPDYSQPKLVQWLCRPHHLDLHKNEQLEVPNG
jgi:hypothetical protein